MSSALMAAPALPVGAGAALAAAAKAIAAAAAAKLEAVLIFSIGGLSSWEKVRCRVSAKVVSWRSLNRLQRGAKNFFENAL
jgi:hypothetical protein